MLKSANLFFTKNVNKLIIKIRKNTFSKIKTNKLIIKTANTLKYKRYRTQLY